MRKAHMQYHWWKYALVLMTAVCVWGWTFHAVAQPKENERLHILLVGESFDEKSLESDLMQMLPNLTQQELRQIKVTQSKIIGDDAWRILQARFYEYDLVIIDEAYLPRNIDAAVDYQGMTKEMLLHFSKEMLYAVTSANGTAAYGFEAGEEANLNQYFSGEGKCYCFPSPWSVNYAALNGSGSEQDDCGQKVLEYLLCADSE